MSAQAQSLTQEAAQLFGPSGVDLIEDNASHAGLWCSITFRIDTIFATLEGNGMSGTWTGKTFLAGTSISNGLGFTKINLTSGSIVANKA